MEATVRHSCVRICPEAATTRQSQVQMRMQSSWGRPMVLVGMQNHTVTLAKSLAVFK